MPVTSRGFTLLETLIVLGLMGLLMAIIVPKALSGRDYYTLGKNTRSVSSVMRLARGQAIAEQKETVVTFNLEEKTYQLPPQKAKKLDEAIHLEVFTSTAEISDDEKTAGIRFYPDGGASGGRVTLTLDDDSRAIDVVWMTGKIHILDDVSDAN